MAVRTRGIVRSFTAPFLTAMLVISAVFFGLVPGWIDLQIAQRSLMERTTIASLLERKAAQLESLDEGELEQQARDATLAVPIVIPYQQVLNEIASTTTRYALAVKELVLTSERRPDSAALVVHLSLVGTREKISGFVGNLYRLVPLVTVQSLEFSRTSASEENTTLSTAKLTMKFHHAALPLSIGKASEPLPTMTDEIRRVLLSLREYESISVTPGDTAPFTPLDRLFPVEDFEED